MSRWLLRAPLCAAITVAVGLGAFSAGCREEGAAEPAVKSTPASASADSWIPLRSGRGSVLFRTSSISTVQFDKDVRRSRVTINGGGDYGYMNLIEEPAVTQWLLRHVQSQPDSWVEVDPSSAGGLFPAARTFVRLATIHVVVFKSGQDEGGSGQQSRDDGAAETEAVQLLRGTDGGMHSVGWVSAVKELDRLRAWLKRSTISP